MVVRKTGYERNAGAPFLKDGYYLVEVAKYMIARKTSPPRVALIDKFSLGCALELSLPARKCD